MAKGRVRLEMRRQFCLWDTVLRDAGSVRPGGHVYLSAEHTHVHTGVFCMPCYMVRVYVSAENTCL